MTLRFKFNGKPDEAFNFIIRRTAAEGRFQIYLCLREKAWPQFSVSRQTEAVAFSAEMVTESADESDFSDSTIKSEISCGPGFSHSNR